MDNDALDDEHVVASRLTGEKRRATRSDGDDREHEHERQKRGKFFGPSTIAGIPTHQPQLSTPGSSSASRAYATPGRFRSPGPYGSVPPLPLPTFFTDRALSTSELSKLLISLSTHLSPPAIATALHQFGIDSVARFAHLHFAQEGWLTEALEKLESQIPRFRRIVLMKSLAAKRAEFEGR